MKQEEIKNGNVSWKIFIWVVGLLISGAVGVYAISTKAMDEKFDNVDKELVQLRQDFNKHIEIQNTNDLKIAEGLGEIKQALGIKSNNK